MEERSPRESEGVALMQHARTSVQRRSIDFLLLNVPPYVPVDDVRPKKGTIF
jgi:hypothetical protein